LVIAALRTFLEVLDDIDMIFVGKLGEIILRELVRDQVYFIARTSIIYAEEYSVLESYL
jgi:hypothetical protein